MRDTYTNNGSKKVKAGKKKLVLEMFINGNWEVVAGMVPTNPADIPPQGTWDWEGGVSIHYAWRTRFEDN